MARPNKPNELHILHGTDRADRGTNTTITITEPVAKPPALIDFSQEFNKDKIFDLLSNWVIHITGAAEVDGLLLSLLVDQYEIYHKAKKDVYDRGVMLDGSKGPYINPSQYLMNNALDKIHKLMREFGMTPATRNGIRAAEQMNKNPMTNIMKGVQ